MELRTKAQYISKVASYCIVELTSTIITSNIKKLLAIIYIIQHFSHLFTNIYVHKNKT